MGFLSNLFRSKEERELEALLAPIRRLIEDEKYQVELLDPAVQQMLSRGAAVDQIAGAAGPFGYAESNPVPVNGPLGELAYLSKLQTRQAGERLLFHRLGSVGTVDAFEAVTFSGSAWFILFLDMYHPRRSRAVPEGFQFYDRLGQFSGFTSFCASFPYDFAEAKQSQRNAGLSVAYIPTSNVAESIKSKVFNRPLAHTVKLELVSSRLTGRKT